MAITRGPVPPSYLLRLEYGGRLPFGEKNGQGLEGNGDKEETTRHLEVSHAHAYARSAPARTVQHRRSGWHRREEDPANSRGHQARSGIFLRAGRPRGALLGDER